MITQRTQIQTQATDEITGSDIEQRATELAHMDGRTSAKEHDMHAATEELTQSLVDPEPTAEPTPRVWNAPSVSTGSQAPSPYSQNEQIVPEQLVKQGMAEAEREHRLAAAEENLATQS